MDHFPKCWLFLAFAEPLWILHGFSEEAQHIMVPILQSM